jgi:glycosyltransferase involved in cell wall biosynthesis
VQANTRKQQAAHFRESRKREILQAEMTIRIAQIIPTLDQGGAEKQMCLLASGLDRTRFECHVITLTRDGPRKDELLKAGIPVHSIAKRGKFDPLAWHRLNRILKSIKPDIVHTWLFAANSYGRLAALWNKVPVIVGGERCVDPWKSTWHFVVDRFLARYSQAIVTNSSGVVDFYNQHGIAKDRFRIIPNGIRPSNVTPITREEAYARLGVPSDRKIIACVGRLWPQKGHADLLWAMELFRVVRDGAMLVIIGDGPLRERLELLIDQYRIANDVRMAGERTDVAQLMPHFDMIIQASQYEGQSNVIMEAMQCGVPVIATNIPGNRDLVESGVDGVLIELGDPQQMAQAMFGILDQPEHTAELVAAAKRKMASEFTVELMIERHADLYRELYDQAKKRR